MEASSSGSSGSTQADAGDDGPVEPQPNWLVQCFYGAAIAGFDAANPEIEAACASLPHTPVKRADGKFGWEFLDVGGAYDALFKALDTNGDSTVDDDDEDYSIALLGHSWGGMNVVDVGKRLQDDARVTSARKRIALGVVWDPYKLGSSQVEPTSNFERFVSLRRSKTSPGDCSGSAPLGPYYGLPLRCAANATCDDYDYSLNPSQAFPAYPSGTLQGSAVEHCNIVDVGFVVAKALLDGTAPTLPTRVGP